MKDGFKIVDVDAHLMEPDWVFERFIDENTSRRRPKWASPRNQAGVLFW